jgi:hypothetical protein
MFQGSIVPGSEFILDVQNDQLTVRDIVRIRYFKADCRDVVVVQANDTNVLVRFKEEDFRKHANPRIPLLVTYEPAGHGDDRR